MAILYSHESILPSLFTASPNPTPNPIPNPNPNPATDGLARRLRLNFFFHGRNSATRDPNFRMKSTWMPPFSNTFLECELKILDSAVNNIPDALPKGNLPKNEQIALKNLAKNKDIIIKPADKGAAIVVMDKKDYIAETKRQLSHPIHYKTLDQPVFPQAITQINEIFQELKDLKFIDKSQYDYPACLSDPKPRRMYLLPKIHKEKDKCPPPPRVTCRQVDLSFPTAEAKVAPQRSILITSWHRWQHVIHPF